MASDVSVEELRKKFESVRNSGPAAEVRAAAVAYYRARAAEGATQPVVASELGLTRWTLAKWHQLQDGRAGHPPTRSAAGSAPFAADGEAAALRREVDGLGPRNPSRRFPEELKRRITEWAREQLAAGRGRKATAEQVGVPWETLFKWLGPQSDGARAALKAVRVVASPSRATSSGAVGPVLRSPGGFVVEGLDIPSLVEVLRRLG